MPCPIEITLKVDGLTWDVPPKYELVSKLGSGTFGIVVRALDQETSQSVRKHVATTLIARLPSSASTASLLVVAIASFDYCEKSPSRGSSTVTTF